MNILRRLDSLRLREHAATVELIETLLECHRSKAYLDAGYSSIWDLLVRRLHYSEAAASRRYAAMRCAAKFPQVLVMLREHRTSLTALAKVAGSLEKASNPEELLGEIDGRCQRDVEKVVARRRPVTRSREQVKRQAVRPRHTSATLFDTPKPETEDRIRLAFSVSEEDYEAFERAKAILSRKLPKGITMEQAFRELVTFFLDKKEPKRRQPAKRKRAKNRHIPKATRDHVFARDESRCTFAAGDGTRCTATHNLHVDHIRPYSLGGSHDASNLRLLCAAHNQRRNDRVPPRKSHR